jgi:hypothetical protein
LDFVAFQNRDVEPSEPLQNRRPNITSDQLISYIQDYKALYAIKKAKKLDNSCIGQKVGVDYVCPPNLMLLSDLISGSD